MRGASRHLLRAGRACLRAGARARRSPRRARRAVRRQRARHQPQGFRRQCVLGRRFPRRRGTEEIVLTDPGIGLYKKLVVADGRLTGAVLFGDTADGLWYLDLIRSGASIAHIRDDLAFGRAFAERAAPAPAASWPRDMSGDFSPEQKRYLEGFVSGLNAARATRGALPARQGRADRSRRDPPQGAGPRHGGGRQARRAGEVQARAASLRCLRPAEGAGGERTSRRSPPTISAGATTGSSTWRPRRTPTCAGCASRTAS